MSERLSVHDSEQGARRQAAVDAAAAEAEVRVVTPAPASAATPAAATPAAAAPILLPGSRVGILGGGQLGRMMALAGQPLGYRFATLDPTSDSPAGQVCERQFTADFDDIAAAQELASWADVVTYEFENVSATVAAALAGAGYVPQGSRLLATTQHRLREKAALVAAGIPVAPFHAVRSLADVHRAGAELGYPLILKTAFGGYDGKGQWRLEDRAETENIWVDSDLKTVVQRAQADADPPLVVEQALDLAAELSLIIARSPRGETQLFPLAENVHRHHILHLTIAPARVSTSLQQAAAAIARRAAQALDAVGLLTVEMFVTQAGALLVNELAPRPHNSGHFTIDACVTSQFEQSVRAVCNLPLGDTRQWAPAVMVNILGDQMDAVRRLLAQLPGEMKLHLYGKSAARSGRKMGHLTVVAADGDIGQVLRKIDALGVWAPLQAAEVQLAGP